MKTQYGLSYINQSSFTCKWDAVGYRGLYTLDMCQTRGFHFPRCNSPLRVRVSRVNYEFSLKYNFNLPRVYPSFGVVAIGEYIDILLR